MSLIVAFAYRSEKSLGEQLARLRASTGWEWIERDSAFWGDYISARASPEDLLVKIFEEGDGYLFEFKCLSPEAEARWEDLTRLALRQLAPIVEAQEVQRAEPNN